MTPETSAQSPSAHASAPQKSAIANNLRSDNHRLLAATCAFVPDEAAAALVRILDDYLEQLKSGDAPSRSELIARHPEVASELEACLAGLEFLHAAESPDPDRPQRLGDFQIIREVGRGGMGAVFEAEQISLGRRVALKILRFGAVSDPDALERFHREAETVATLHHTNIVPIFAVGCERGVNYYAMQFIEGESLAELMVTKSAPFPAERVAEWGLQAAEALAHAHQRGVIHRDVKPSNLILDKDNRLWLTDFGLARRMDDVTLSLTGALLGTPRYMSPEQAAAIHKRVDHRSDLFSFGATLYEVLAGQPAFSGDTPHDVIQQILTSEPTPVRQLVRNVPRDLETIVLKCLAKEPAHRYRSARDLGDDLRAFLDGRPIRARRASAAELAARWMKRQQRSVKLAATAAAVTLFIAAAGLMGWWRYDAWRQASLQLDAVAPPLVAEILDSQGNVKRVETAPMQNPVQLPAGEKQIRVSARGQLSDTLDLTLERGSESKITLNLHDQMLFTPRDIERGFDLIKFGSEKGLVLWNENGMGLRKQFHPLGWTRKLSAQHFPTRADAVGFRWPWNQFEREHSGYAAFDTRPWVLPQAIDIDGHGAGDLIVAARHQAWLLAVSGEEGAILWFAARGHDLARRAPQTGIYEGHGLKSAMLGTPQIGKDYDADGVPDLIVTFADIGEQPTIRENRYSLACWVEATSAKTGNRIWRFDIPTEWFALDAGEEVPYDLRWFAGSRGGTISGGRSSMSDGRHRRRGIFRLERTGPHGYQPAAVQLLTIDGAPRLGIVAGRTFAALDPATGQLATQPIDVGARAGRPCQWGDVDGDGSNDLVLIEEPTANGAFQAGVARVLAWSPSRRAELWSRTLDAHWPRQPSWTVEAPKWPLVVDLDGDAKCEVVVPDGRSPGSGGLAGGQSVSDIPWGSVAVLAGQSGETKWSRQLVSIDSQVDHFLDGPDVDQDGCREIYAVTLEGVDFRVHVDALSGRDGGTLWNNSYAPPPDSNSSVEYNLSPPQWWHAGEDGWPQLLTHIVEGDMEPRRTFWGAFSAGTGHLSRVGRDITAAFPADFDGDGTQDLLIYNSKAPRALDVGGKVHCLRGVPREKWARLGRVGQPAADFDGDGVCDLVYGWPDDTVTAVSAASGKSLWRSRPFGTPREFHVVPAVREDRFGPTMQCAATGDLNGDGTPDLLGWSHVSNYRTATPVFHAISGKSGKPLWAAHEISVQLLSGVLSASAHDLDGDGRLEVLWIASLDYGYPVRQAISMSETQLWMFVTSGQSGKLLWSHALSPAYGGPSANMSQVQFQNVMLSPVVGDVNGDGACDVLVPAILPSPGTLETRAVSGKDGVTLWTRPCTFDPGRQLSLANWTPPAVGDLNADGRAEVVVAEFALPEAAGVGTAPTERVVAVAGRDGSEQWRWTGNAPIGYGTPVGNGALGELRRPRLLRAGGGHQRVGVLISGNNGKLLVFDSLGQVVERDANYETFLSGIWPCDTDGDGIDEVVFVDHSFLRVVPADKLDQPIWTRSLGSVGSQRILGIVPKEEGSAPVIAVALDGSDNSVHGFDAAAGSTVWTCPGPIPRDANDSDYLVPSHIALLSGGEREPPHVYYGYGSVSRCRQAAILTSTSAPGAVAHRGVSRVDANSSGIVVDSRWERDLPWFERHVSGSQSASIVAWSLLFSTAFVVLPGGYALLVTARRRFSIWTLLALPVVVGLFLTAFLTTSPSDQTFPDYRSRLMAGFLFAPVALSAGLLGWRSAQRQFANVALWLGVSVMLSVLLAAGLLWHDFHSRPLLPQERYGVSGWYLIWLIGVYLSSWLLVISVVVKYAWLGLRSRWRKRS